MLIIRRTQRSHKKDAESYKGHLWRSPAERIIKVIIWPAEMSWNSGKNGSIVTYTNLWSTAPTLAPWFVLFCTVKKVLSPTVVPWTWQKVIHESQEASGGKLPKKCLWFPYEKLRNPRQFSSINPEIPEKLSRTPSVRPSVVMESPPLPDAKSYIVSASFTPGLSKVCYLYRARHVTLNFYYYWWPSFPCGAHK